MKKVILGFNLPSWLTVLLLLIILLRIPSLFEPFSYGDECLYLTLGQALKKGLVFYRDIHDNKPPLLYLLASFANSVFWFRFLLLLNSLLMVFVFFRILSSFFVAERRLIMIATVAFGILSSIPKVEGNIANAEVFMALPTLAGILLLFCGKLSHQRIFSAGIFFSLAALFKFPAVFDFGAVVLFFAFFLPKKNFYTWATQLGILATGFLLPITLTFIYYWTQGAFSQYFTAAFLQNFGYLSSWKGKTVGLLVGSGLLLKSVFLLLLTGVVYRLRKSLSPFFSFIFLWFIFSLFAATLSERPYPHYLFQVLPPTCILLGGLVSRFGRREKILALGCLLLLKLTVDYYNFWSYPLRSYYQNFFRFATRQKNLQEYLAYFGAQKNYRLADFITKHSQKDEKIFLWGDSPCLYALSRRLPTGRYTTAYHIIDFNGFKEIAQTIEREKPRLIIDLKTEGRPFPELDQILKSKYFPYQTLEGAEIFLLNPSR